MHRYAYAGLNELAVAVVAAVIFKHRNHTAIKSFSTLFLFFILGSLALGAVCTCCVPTWKPGPVAAIAPLAWPSLSLADCHILLSGFWRLLCRGAQGRQRHLHGAAVDGLVLRHPALQLPLRKDMVRSDPASS